MFTLIFDRIDTGSNMSVKNSLVGLVVILGVTSSFTLCADIGDRGPGGGIVFYESDDQ